MKDIKINIRVANITDLPQILELYKKLQPQDPPIEFNAAISVWEEAVNSGVTYFVADHDGFIVATCYIAIIPNITRQCVPIGFIENIVTAADYLIEKTGYTPYHRE